MSTPQEQAQAYADLLMSTGMAYEITPHTIAYRAFLDGFAAGADKHPDTARLDWLEKTAESVTFEDAPHATIWSVANHPGDNCDVRKAIDLAMKERL